MSYDAANLPASFVRLLTRAQRLELGIKSPDELAAGARIESERQLQGLLVNVLRLRGIEVLWHRLDRRSGATVGWPDLTFAVEVPAWPYRVAVGWEVKLPGEDPAPEQGECHQAMQRRPNCWRVAVVRSVDDALAELRALGL